MSPTRILAAAIVAAGAATVQAADDNKVTIENRIAQCQGCHGIPDWKTAFPEVYHVPKLGGQKPGYIVAALKEYRSGERDFATMKAIAANLSDADIDAVARYYGGELPATAAAAPAPAAAAPAPAEPATATPPTAPASNATNPAAPAAKKK
jgi:cytochrome c553